MKTLLQKAKELKKQSNRINSVIDVADKKQLYDLVKAILNEQIPLLAFGESIGATKQGSYSAFTHAIKRLYREKLLQIKKTI